MNEICFKRERFLEDIRLGRLALRLSQSEVGKWFGVSAMTVSKWENGKAEVNVERFLIYCRKLFIDPLNYIHEEDDKDAIANQEPDPDGWRPSELIYAVSHHGRGYNQ
jgi:transcriptional regulator with XRE-family HTH domain